MCHANVETRDGTRWTSSSEDTNRSNPSTKYESHFLDFRDRTINDFSLSWYRLSFLVDRETESFLGMNTILLLSKLGGGRSSLTSFSKVFQKEISVNAFSTSVNTVRIFNSVRSWFSFGDEHFLKLFLSHNPTDIFRCTLDMTEDWLRAQCRILLHHEKQTQQSERRHNLAPASSGSSTIEISAKLAVQR